MITPQSPELEAIVSLAKQGESSAIATFLNLFLNSSGIMARVGYQDHCLGILLESDFVPEPAEPVALIRQKLAELQPPSVRFVTVVSYQPGNSEPAWHEAFDLVTEPATVPTAASHFPAPALTRWLHQGQSANPIETASIHGNPIPEAETDWLPLDFIKGTSPLTVDEFRFLRLYFNASETALLSLSAIQQVLNIPVPEILPVPHMPDCVLGSYNWRGEMLWLVDLAQQLGCSSRLNLHHLDTTIAIAIESDRQFLGIVVPRLGDVEVHDRQQLQPPTTAFPAKLKSFMSGYFIAAQSPVLNARALNQDSRLQVHCAD